MDSLLDYFWNYFEALLLSNSDDKFKFLLDEKFDELLNLRKENKIVKFDSLLKQLMIENKDFKREVLKLNYNFS